MSRHTRSLPGVLIQLVLVATVAVQASAAAARPVTETEAMAVSRLFADALWGKTSSNGCWKYEDVTGGPGAYCCERVLEGGTSITLMVGGRTDMPPVLLYYQGRPPEVSGGETALQAASRELDGSDVWKVASVYYSPLDLWFEYQAEDGRRTMISARDFRVSEPERVRGVEPLTRSLSEETRFEEEWASYLAGEPPALLDGLKRIPDVPDWDWHYGCAPTAAANVLTFWDECGYGLLVDSVMANVPDPIEGDRDSVPNVSWQLAVAMGTDTIESGRTDANSIPMGIADVCAGSDWGNHYDFTSFLAWNEHGLIVEEVKAGRPGVMVLTAHPDYGSHAVTFHGWGPPDTGWIAVRDVWGEAYKDIVIRYDHGAPVGVIPIVPGDPPAPDIGVAGIARPEDGVRPGAIRPKVRLENLGGTATEADVFFRVERPGGGLSESFDDTLSFPPARWHRFNVDGCEDQWDVDAAPDGRAACVRDASRPASDDWLVTPKVRVRPNDTLRFWFRALGLEAESVEVRVSYSDSAPQSFSQTVRTVCCELEGADPGWVDFSDVGDTSVYIGFRYLREPGAPGIGVCLDDVILRTVYYSDSQTVGLEPGQELPVEFTPWVMYPGHYVARCSIYQRDDSESGNDTRVREFSVSELAEEPPLPHVSTGPRSLRILPNPARSFIRGIGWDGPGTATVFDATGRRVMVREIEGAGRIELPRLAAGVYVLRLHSPLLGSATASFLFTN
ncbi:MAG: T9SS type A sorting domain-containing protein [candidate division WOR-3 bacterium]|nr:MAG: T9SS type A sorting domain-containing protein [candidate division WOR-3 bacterium]